MSGLRDKFGEIKVVNFEDIPTEKVIPVYEFGPGPDPDIDIDEQTQLARNLAEGVAEANADGNPKTFELPDEGDVLESIEKLAGEQPGQE